MTNTIQKTAVVYKGVKFPAYEIHSNGEIVNISRGSKAKGRIMGNTKQVSVTLTLDGKAKYVNLSAAMIESFKGIVTTGDYIGYKDNNPENNDLDNIVVLEAKSPRKNSGRRKKDINSEDDKILGKELLLSGEQSISTERRSMLKSSLEDLGVKLKGRGNSLTIIESKNDFVEDDVIILDCKYNKAIKRLDELGLEDIRRSIRKSAIERLNPIPNLSEAIIANQEIDVVRTKLANYDFTKFPFYSSESIYTLHIEHGDIMPIIDEDAITLIAFKYMQNLQTEGYIKKFNQSSDSITVYLFGSSLSMHISRINDNQEGVLLDIIRLCNMVKRIKPINNMIGLPF